MHLMPMARAFAYPAFSCLITRALPALLVGFGCGGGVDVEAIEEDIARELKDYSIAVQEVRCPKDVPDETGRSFSCVARADGAEIGIRVTLTDGPGDMRWRHTSGLVRSAELEDRIEEWLSDQIGGSFWIDCGRSHRVAVPGRTFTCVAEADTGHARNLRVTIEDEKGNVRWVVKD